MMRRPSCLSIFSGGGGLDIGFENAGFTIIGATDADPACKETFSLNRPEIPFKVGSASEYDREYFTEFINSRDLDSVDCLIGGPPCPAFSKSRFYRKEKARGLQDKNTDETISGYLKVLETIAPQYFVLENVKGLTYKSHADSLSYILKNVEKLGYRHEIWVINAADFGVPQIRERAFIIGSKGELPTMPERTHAKDADDPDLIRNILPWTTAGSVLNDLPSNVLKEIPGHFAGGKHHELLKSVPPGDNYLFFTEKRKHPEPKFKWRSRYWSFLLKLSPDMPSWTIQARRSNNMGPFHWQNRILTIEEIKRLQTFPDDWSFSGTTERQWRQIGNAVPCRLAEFIASAIIETMTKKKSIGYGNGKEKLSPISE